MRIRMLARAATLVCTYVGLLAAVIGGPVRPQQDSQTTAVAKTDELGIRNLLVLQADAWNRGDIDSFMTSYWKSDDTTFVGTTGIIRGWHAVLERYHRAYPNRESMGHLTFSNIEVHQQCANAAFVIGEYRLQREKDSPAGVFTLDLRKFDEGWRIVLDHTTAFSATPPSKGP